MPNGSHTFLFMDLVGFTALTAERGDDSAAEVALRLFERIRPVLPEHSGEEIKTIGDAMMVRCEDPRQGVELGLRISEQIGDQPDLPPLRIAVSHRHRRLPRRRLVRERRQRRRAPLLGSGWR